MPETKIGAGTRHGNKVDKTLHSEIHNLERDQQTSSVNGWMRDILCSVGHMTSVIIPQLYCYSTKVTACEWV